MSTKRARNKSTMPQLSRALQYRGLLTRVARKLDLHRAHVSRVARGQRKSRRVMDALLQEIERIEGAQRKAAA
jgi:hypothetical protein